MTIKLLMVLSLAFLLCKTEKVSAQIAVNDEMNIRIDSVDIILKRIEFELADEKV